MSTAPALAAKKTIALIGNPNTGKTTVFNQLTGSNAQVGNYAGVTIAHRHAPITIDNTEIDLIDLPGTYSLTAQSPDELVTVDVLLGQHESLASLDGIIAIVDASNAQRNMYLVSQLCELGLPLVIVFNKIDVAQQRGITVDTAELTQRLGVPVLSMQANQSKATEQLQQAVSQLLSANAPSERCQLPEAMQSALAKVQSAATQDLSATEAMRILIDSNGAAEQRAVQGALDSSKLGEIRQTCNDTPLAAQEATARYAWVRKILQGAVIKPDTPVRSKTDRVDRILTHKVWGSLSFLALSLLVFQSLYSWAGPFMDLIDQGFGALGDFAGSYISHPVLHSLIVDGVIAGVGGILIFLPQILILFAFMTVLEDCGYMARAAFLMDRVFAKFGLSGKSFIPLLSSFACAVPGIMATRTIENRRDRIATMMVAPLMSCSARLPVYTILIASFVPATTWLGMNVQGLTLFAMHLLGLVIAIPIVFLLKRSVLKGPTPAFVMELPRYQRPSLRRISQRLFERGWAFVKNAGTIIFVMSLIVWALSYFPRDAAIIAQHDAMRTEGTVAAAQIDQLEASALLEASYLGQMGHAIEPIVKPLGWDWKIGTATLASFPAREVIVSVLGILYNLGDSVDEESAGLHSALQNATWPDGTPIFNLAVALSIMVFFALCCQCGATVATIKREANSWGWAIFAFSYMTVLAYVGAWATYRITSMLA